MYRVIIYGFSDKFTLAVHAKEFNRRGLIRFLSRHVFTLLNYGAYGAEVAVSRDNGPACPVNFFLVGQKHMSDRIPTNRVPS